MIIRGRSPLRLGLAGGGTDIASFSDQFGGCVLNATIDRYVYATLEITEADSVRFISGDLERVDTLPYESCFPLNQGLVLHRAVYNYFISNYNKGRPLGCTVHTLAEAPAGSGLGTSSTLVVALCSVFAEYFRAGLDEYELASLAFEIERTHCGLAGGKQDQYTAAFGGLNFMEFMPSGRVLVNPLRIKRRILNEFEASLLLYFTGVSRESDSIIRDQSDNVKKMDSDALNAMHEIKREAYAMKESLLTGDFESLYASFHNGWENKKRSAKNISNPEIDTLYENALSSGAAAAKISGAGGGGFMMVLVPPARRSSVMKTLARAGGEFFPAHFTESGAETWRV